MEPLMGLWPRMSGVFHVRSGPVGPSPWVWRTCAAESQARGKISWQVGRGGLAIFFYKIPIRQGSIMYVPGHPVTTKTTKPGVVLIDNK